MQAILIISDDHKAKTQKGTMRDSESASISAHAVVTSFKQAWQCFCAVQRNTTEVTLGIFRNGRH
jgi:hypothetical protein